jgi:hypothetical protein
VLTPPSSSSSSPSSAPPPSAAQQARVQLFRARNEHLQGCAALLSRLAAYPSRRLALELVKAWLRFLRVEGLAGALDWLPALIAHLLPGAAPVHWRLSAYLTH